MSRCPICDKSDNRRLGPHPDFTGHSIVRCHTCGMMSIDPRPSFDRLAEIYPVSYREAVDEKPTDHYLAFMDMRAVAQKAFISTHLRLQDQSRVLDIGCSAGSLLLALGVDTPNLDGYEPDTMMAGLARDRLPSSARIFNELCDPSTLPADTYDLITLSHVFEHVLEPVDFLNHLLRALRPNGLVFIEVPSESITEVKRQVRAAFPGKLHLSYFNPDTLGLCATRSGATTAKMSTYGPSTSQFSLVPDEMLRPRAKRTLLTRAYGRVRRTLLPWRDRKWIGSIDLAEYLGTDNGSDGIWIRALFSRSG